MAAASARGPFRELWSFTRGEQVTGSARGHDQEQEQRTGAGANERPH